MLWLCIRLPALERAALTRLAVWAQQWSSWVSLGSTQEDAAVAGAGRHGSDAAADAWLGPDWLTGQPYFRVQASGADLAAGWPAVAGMGRAPAAS